MLSEFTNDDSIWNDKHVDEKERWPSFKIVVGLAVQHDLAIE